MPDALSSPQELVGEHKVVAKGVALCANINKVALSVDGDQADRPLLVAATGRTQRRSNYSSPQSDQCDGRADHRLPIGPSSAPPPSP